MTSIETQTEMPFTAECPICLDNGFKFKDLNVLTCGHLTCRPCGKNMAKQTGLIKGGIEIWEIKCPICREPDLLSVKPLTARVITPAPQPIPQPLTYQYDPNINGLVLVNQPTPQPIPQPTPRPAILYQFRYLDRFNLEDWYKVQFINYFYGNRLDFLRGIEHTITMGTFHLNGDRLANLPSDKIKLKAMIKTYLLTIRNNRPRCVNEGCRTVSGTQRKCPSHALPIPCCQRCYTCCFCRNESPRQQLKERLNSRRDFYAEGSGYGEGTNGLLDAVNYDIPVNN
ncbi:MAG: hypothetical protein QLV_10 [Qinghai Lake virophage]|jgi:RING-finger-containing ubiquitin ligase|uniref:RING-type domain-containing protein n=1 Tax=Qinghai Lake virophage TaxID=1516115 RepID=A0A0R5K4N4_9VIRU|nr:MAG: hypothetical protein QLV_10 [Qinghai Lake virophage]